MVEIVVNHKKDEKYPFEYDFVDGYPVQKLEKILESIVQKKKIK